MKRDEMHAKEIIARKNEKARIKQIKKMKKQSVFISTKLMISIANLSKRSEKAVTRCEMRSKKKRRSKDEMMIMTMFNLS